VGQDRRCLRWYFSRASALLQWIFVSCGIGVVRSGASTAALASCAGVRQPQHWRRAQECVNRGIGVVRRSASTVALAWCAGVRHRSIGVVRRTCRSRLAGEPGLTLAAAVSDQCVRQQAGSYRGSGGSGASMLCAGIFRGQARSYSGFSSAAALAWCAGVRQPQHWRGAQECVNRGIGVVRRTCRSRLAGEPGLTLAAAASDPMRSSERGPQQAGSYRGSGGSGASMWGAGFFAGKRAPTVDFRQLRHWRGARTCVIRSCEWCVDGTKSLHTVPILGAWGAAFHRCVLDFRHGAGLARPWPGFCFC
jgi:hypothetical protein